MQLFSDETLREANDALSSVGWSGVAPASSSLSISEDQMGELTSDDPFVKVNWIICSGCGCELSYVYTDLILISYPIGNR